MDSRLSLTLIKGSRLATYLEEGLGGELEGAVTEVQQAGSQVQLGLYRLAPRRRLTGGGRAGVRGSVPEFPARELTPKMVIMFPSG